MTHPVRTKTPSEIKWLLVERATVAGDIAQREKSLQLITQELAALRSKLHALDSTIEFVNRKLDAKAAGIVLRHTAEYQERGALKNAIIEAIKRAAPGTIKTRTVVDQVIAKFGLNLASKAERQEFTRNAVGRQIRLLTQQGLVEALHPPGSRRGVWRWKDQQPTFQDLLKLTSPG